MQKTIKIKMMPAKEFFASFPSAVKNQCIRDAKSIYKKHTKGVIKTIIVCIDGNSVSAQDTRCTVLGQGNGIPLI